MKQIGIYVLLFCSIFSTVSAQTFAFFRHGVQLNNNAVVNVSEFTTEDGAITIESGLEVRNLTTLNFMGVVTQHVIQKPQNGIISFCFGNCVFTNEDLTLETVVSSSNTTALHVYYASEAGKYGNTSVEYTVYSKLNPSETRKVTVNFNYNATRLNSLSGDMNSVRILHQGGRVQFAFQFPSENVYQLQLLDLTGKVLAETSTKNKSGNWVPDLKVSKGIYFLRVRANSTLSFSRKIVL